MLTSTLHGNGSSSIVACVFISAGTCLPSRCLAMNVYSSFAIPASRRHVTILNFRSTVLQFCLSFFSCVWNLQLVSHIYWGCLEHGVKSTVFCRKKRGGGINRRLQKMDIGQQQYFYFSPKIIVIIQSRLTKWVVLVAHRGEMRKA
jgi:hypothetical protein